MRYSWTCGSIAAMAACASVVSADVILGNYPIANDLTQSANMNNLRRKAMAFAMPAGNDYVVSSITLRLGNYDAGDSAFLEIRDHNGTATSPGASIVGTFNAPAGGGVANADYIFTPAAPIVLQAGTSYWIYLHGGPSPSSFDWRASSPAITPIGIASFGPGNLFTTDGGASWTNSSVINSFIIEGTVASPLSPVGPFTGTLQEDYETFISGSHGSGPMSIFGGAASLSSSAPSLFIFGVGASFGLAGNGTAQVFSGTKGFGLDSATAVATINFSQPVTRFGGYWSHSTLGVNRVELTFKTPSGGVIGVEHRTVADPTGTLHWFGWESTTPIGSVEIGGRFPANDFLQATGTCYANCDGSTTAPILNVADFGCFLSRFAAGAAYANCDGSTTQPVLNVADFGCFLSKFAAGCP